MCGPDPARLAQYQAAFTALMPDTAQVQRATRVSDGMGGAVVTPATVATVACRIQAAGNSPQERALAERVQAVVLWIVSVPVGTNVQSTDQLIIAGRTYEVVAPLGPESFALELRVACVEVS